MPFDQNFKPNDSSKVTAENSHARLSFCDVFEMSGQTAKAAGLEVALLAASTIGGAVQECQKDPVETVVRAGTTFAVGTGLGALAAVESPVIAAGALATGAVLTGAWAIDTLNPYDVRNQQRYAKIGSAMNDVWHRPDSKTFEASLQKMQEGMGPIALDLCLMGVGAKGAHLGAKQLSRLAPQFNIVRSSGLAPAAVPGYYEIQSGRSLGAFDDFLLFKQRAKRATVNQGPPETIDARCAELDAVKGIVEPTPQPVPVRDLKEPLVPPSQRTNSGRPFFFHEKAAPFHKAG